MAESMSQCFLISILYDLSKLIKFPEIQYDIYITFIMGRNFKRLRFCILLGHRNKLTQKCFCLEEFYIHVQTTYYCKRKAKIN